MILMFSLDISVLAQERKPNTDDNLSISDYCNAYQQAEDDNLLSLDKYNQEYDRLCLGTFLSLSLFFINIKNLQ